MDISFNLKIMEARKIGFDEWWQKFQFHMMLYVL
jgi:hypothetical protein